ncbi:MAG: Gfo/Idh/MocA family protein [Puniceicoccales bacterium]
MEQKTPAPDSCAPIRIGIVGLGGMARNHTRNLLKMPSLATLTAGCDIQPKAVESFTEEFPGVQGFTDAESMFASGLVDAVLITTIHYTHPPLAIAALRAGLHVMIEKPAGVYSKQVREMNEVASQSDRIFGVMFNQRAEPAHRKIRELCQGGEIGEIQRMAWTITDWYRTEAYYRAGGWRGTWAGEGGGVLVNQCPHQLDLLQWFCGMPARIFAHCQFGRFHEIETEDAVTALMEFPNGATGVFTTSTGEAPGFNRLEIVGDSGTILFESGKLHLRKIPGLVSEHRKSSQSSWERPEFWECEIPTVGAVVKQHETVLRNWLEAIRDKVDLLAPGEEGIRGVELANAMHLSAWRNEWVTLPVDEDAYLAELRSRGGAVDEPA